MKKFVVLSCLILCVVLLFSSCLKSEAVKNTELLIENIGILTLDSEKAIKEAEKAYKALTDEEKEKVENYEELVNKRETFDSAEKFNDAVSEIVDETDAKFANAKANITDMLDSANDLLSEYNSMDEEKKALVSDFSSLEGVIDTLKSYKLNAEKAAGAYVKAFYAINEDEDYTVKAVYCIKQIRDNGDEYHMFALDYLNKGKTETIYSTARFISEAAYSLIIEKEDVFFVEEPLNDSTNAVKSGNITLDIEEVLKYAE